MDEVESESASAAPHDTFSGRSAFKVCGHQASAGSAIMASLLPLLHDLLPMIMPSKPHVVRGHEPPSVEERAETAPWYLSTSGAEKVTGASSPAPRSGTGNDGHVSISPSESGAGQPEPIQLLDREARHVAAAVPERPQRVPSSSLPRPPEQTDGPRVSRQDVMVGVTDKMCATGKLKSLSYSSSAPSSP